MNTTTIYEDPTTRRLHVTGLTTGPTEEDVLKAACDYLTPDVTTRDGRVPTKVDVTLAGIGAVDARMTYAPQPTKPDVAAVVTPPAPESH